MFGYFAVERDEEGRPKPPAAPVPSPREMFAYHCFLGGVYDRGRVARLWREEQARQREAAE